MSTESILISAKFLKEEPHIPESSIPAKLARPFSCGLGRSRQNLENLTNDTNFGEIAATSAMKT